MRLPSVASIGTVLIGAIAAATVSAKPTCHGPTVDSGGRRRPASRARNAHRGPASHGIDNGRLGTRRPGGEEAVLRTTDGGSEWTDVTPVSLRHSIVLLGTSGMDHAWLALSGISGGQRTLTVYRTGDAGKSWTRVESILLPDQYPDPVPLAPGLQFVDLDHGWLTLAFQGAEPTSSGVAIYATTDGGQRWQAVSVTLDAATASSPNGLPLGCLKTGIVFNTQTTGWATAHCADGSLYFYVTHDGGGSWHPQALPPPAGYPPNLFGNCVCGSLPPRFAGSPRDGVLMFHFPDLLYVTHDGGGTWRAVTLPARYVADADMIDGQDGWLLSLAADPQSHALAFDRLYLTHDGGQAWEPVKPDHALNGAVQFIDTLNGWLIDRHSRPPELYRTTDGGLSWERVEPHLIGRPSRSV